MKYFKKSELSCKCGCGKYNIAKDLEKTLDKLRKIYGKAIIVNSGSRCTKHNKKIKGSKSSSHLKGLAVDIKVTNSNDRFNIVSILINKLGIKRIGVYKTFIHFDIDPDKSQRVIW